MHDGSQALKETDGNGQVWADIRPTMPPQNSSMVFSFWMYHTAGDPAELHYGGILQHNAASFPDSYYGASPLWFFSIGAFASASSPYTFDPTVYQGVWDEYTSAGARKSGMPFIFNLNEGGTGTRRSTGWHKMSIKMWRFPDVTGNGRIYWYVDDNYGNDADQPVYFGTSDAPDIKFDSVYLGNMLNSRYLKGNTGAGDGRSAFYDDVSIAEVPNTPPYLILTPVNATEGVPMTPVDQMGVDDDVPESVILTVIDPESLAPTGLTLSATQVRGLPAVITISGTPAPGSAGTYSLTFLAKDDLEVEATDTLFITISPSACGTPRQDADKDGDVDVNDFATFQTCFNGAGNPYPAGADPARCACLDDDADNDVDVNDFARFQACFNGPSQPAACE